MARRNLKNKRKALNLTQQSAAEAVGITRTYYSEIENGNRNCSIRIWLRIAECLEIPKEEIIFYIEEGLQPGA